MGGAVSGVRRNVSVMLADEAGAEKVRWNINNAWPTKFASTGFNASGSDVMVETLDLTFEGIERVK
jgi:phage tail-like protein